MHIVKKRKRRVVEVFLDVRHESEKKELIIKIIKINNKEKKKEKKKKNIYGTLTLF